MKTRAKEIFHAILKIAGILLLGYVIVAAVFVVVFWGRGDKNQEGMNVYESLEEMRADLGEGYLLTFELPERFDPEVNTELYTSYDSWFFSKTKIVESFNCSFFEPKETIVISGVSSKFPDFDEQVPEEHISVREMKRHQVKTYYSMTEFDYRGDIFQWDFDAADVFASYCAHAFFEHDGKRYRVSYCRYDVSGAEILTHYEEDMRLILQIVESMLP